MTILPMRAKVECADSPGGELRALIIDPERQDVTHLVVQHMDEQRLVPINYVAEINGPTIRLHCSDSEIQEMDIFAEKQVIRSEHPETPHMMAYPFPQGIPLGHSPYTVPRETEVFTREIFHPPPGELALHKGSEVLATDELVGHVSELYVAEQNNHITHLGIEIDGFFRKRAMMLPLTAIDHFENDAIYLKWDRQTIEQLPGSSP